MLKQEHYEYLYLENAQEYTKRVAKAIEQGLSLATLLNDIESQELASHRLIMIGEALNRTSDPFQAAHPEIPWKDIIGMRNVLLHDYAKTNYTMVWRTLSQDLPLLDAQLAKCIAEEKQELGIFS